MKEHLLYTIPLNTLTGITSSQILKLSKLGLLTIQDLLFHLPIRYEDRTKLYHINKLKPGIFATIKGKILKSILTSGNRRILICQVSDGSAVITLRFFNFKNNMKNNLEQGNSIIAYGEIKFGTQGFEIIHPEYYVQNSLGNIKLPATLTPIYPTTKGISQIKLRNLTEQALKILTNCQITELFPTELSKEMISFPDALYILHRPPPDTCLTKLKQGKHPAQKRLIIEEWLAHYLSILSVRTGIKHHNALSLTTRQDLVNQLLAILPFSLTIAQQRVIREIENDLANNFPMMRLLQGDVGSGKTLVAALAALNVIAHNKQVVLLAPTELLAEQHVSNFRHWFKPLGIEVSYLSGKQKTKDRTLQQKAIANGQVKMIVGTHALFQEKVKFNFIALIIIDEQHRFGVYQRLTLWEKSKKDNLDPHQLIMTATPIPRTLEMTLYASLDISIIDELPPCRAKVTTVTIPDNRRTEIIMRVQNACRKGRQAFWVCTLIEESEVLKAQSAEVIWEKLVIDLPDLQVGLIHGRMKSEKKQAIMHAFKNNEIQLLVATTIIEVGVDIPNASLMIIENSERLGLAQLHQLRGRVGRGTITSYCVLLYKSPLSKIAQKRLQVLRHTNNGFIIAQHDLEIRGPGELLGTRQTGNTEFKVVNLLRDQYLLREVQNIAYHIYHHYPKQSQDLIKRWLPITELIP